MTSHNPASIVEWLIALTLEHAANHEGADGGYLCPRLVGKDCTTRSCHKRGGWAVGPITLANATCFDLELQTELKEAVAMINALAETLKAAADYFELNSPDNDRMIERMRRCA
jgi:hypothetical protein